MGDEIPNPCDVVRDVKDISTLFVDEIVETVTGMALDVMLGACSDDRRSALREFQYGVGDTLLVVDGYLSDDNQVIVKFDSGNGPQPYTLGKLPAQYNKRPITAADIHPFYSRLGGARGRLSDIKNAAVVEQLRVALLNVMSIPEVNARRTAALEQNIGTRSSGEDQIFHAYVTEEGH